MEIPDEVKPYLWLLGASIVGGILGYYKKEASAQRRISDKAIYCLCSSIFASWIIFEGSNFFFVEFYGKPVLNISIAAGSLVAYYGINSLTNIIGWLQQNINIFKRVK